MSDANATNTHMNAVISKGPATLQCPHGENHAHPAPAAHANATKPDIADSQTNRRPCFRCVFSVPIVGKHPGNR